MSRIKKIIKRYIFPHYVGDTDVFSNGHKPLLTQISSPDITEYGILYAITNSVDPDQTAPPQEQSDQGLHCLP